MCLLKGGHLSWPTPTVENWPTPRVVNWPTARVASRPTLFQTVVNKATEKLKVGLRQFWCRPISSSGAVSWPKNFKLASTIFCVGQTSSLRVGSWPTKSCKLAYTLSSVGQLQV